MDPNNTGPDEGQGISLAGLLNTTDAVAPSEGVILIMTTEKLDPALIRKGRVGSMFHFALPGKEELKDLFMPLVLKDSIQWRKNLRSAYLRIRSQPRRSRDLLWLVGRKTCWLTKPSRKQSIVLVRGCIEAAALDLMALGLSFPIS